MKFELIIFCTDIQAYTLLCFIMVYFMSLLSFGIISEILLIIRFF